MAMHAVSMGIDYYQDTRIPTLQCAARDAQAVNSLFESVGFITDVLINSGATTMSIRRSLAMLARSVEADDTAIVYFAGHGATEPLRRRNSDPINVPFLVPYDAESDDLAGTAIQMDDVGRFLEMIPSKTVLFFFDSCYSGAIANARTFGTQGRRDALRGKPALPDMAGEGTLVVAAAKEYEPAYEDTSVGHGVFTEYLIAGLSGEASTDGNHVTLSALVDHLQTNVPTKTSRLFKHRQHPIRHGTEKEKIVFPIMQESAVRTLVHFPYQFSPLTVVVGDRREPEPKTTGDLFALSASPAELRWLLSLGLPRETEIVSDKVFRQASDSYLQDHYGSTNLLVVGSPAANLLARIVNESAFFSFDVDPGVRDQFESFRGELDKIENDRTKLMNFALDPRNKEGLRFYMNQYRKGGFIDPTYTFLRRGDTIPHDRDYGVVSIARNPYEGDRAGNFLSIMVAGVHLPGTMHALALLGRAREEFRARPLGGVFSVPLTEVDWIRRMVATSPQWSTEPYDIRGMRTALGEAKDKVRHFPGLSVEHIEDRISLCDRFTTSR